MRLLAIAVLALAGTATGCRAPSSSPPSSAPIAAPPASTTQSAPGATHQPGPPILPDPRLTPGATLTVTTDDLCTPGYARAVRDVPVEVKREVYAEYGITDHEPGEYEIDHLISLELGGSNSIKNLWPQSYKTQPWNAHVKDALEDELHRLVCAGQLDLKTAQHDISTHWIGAYQKYFHTDRPLTTVRASRRRQPSAEGEIGTQSEPPGTAATSETSPNPNGGTESEMGRGERVWVNTHSGKYFRPGSRYYGHTKEGEFMTETEARRLGYAAARRD